MSNSNYQRTDDGAYSPWGRWLKPAVAVLIGCMALYVALSLWAGHGRVAEAIARFPTGLFPVLAALALTGWLMRALRFYVFGRYLGWSVSLSGALFAYFACLAFAATP